MSLEPAAIASDRWQMIRDQLHRRGISSRRVLTAMGKVPRERFVPEYERSEAYADRALPIACRQTISQPYMVALMTQSLNLSGTEQVLEIGTGSGYQAAVLAELAAEVITIERHAELSAQAAATLADLGYQNVRLIVGDGTNGCPDAAPYDRIICTAGATQVPPALLEQLVEGGLLVIPIGAADDQALMQIQKVNGQPRTLELTGCRFVPLVGEFSPE